MHADGTHLRPAFSRGRTAAAANDVEHTADHVSTDMLRQACGCRHWAHFEAAAATRAMIKHVVRARLQGIGKVCVHA